MTRTECENLIMGYLHDIWDTAKAYMDDIEGISLHASDGYFNFFSIKGPETADAVYVLNKTEMEANKDDDLRD